MECYTTDTETYSSKPCHITLLLLYIYIFFFCMLNWHASLMYDSHDSNSSFSTFFFSPFFSFLFLVLSFLPCVALGGRTEIQADWKREGEIIRLRLQKKKEYMWNTHCLVKNAEIEAFTRPIANGALFWFLWSGWCFNTRFAD